MMPVENDPNGTRREENSLDVAFTPEPGVEAELQAEAAPRGGRRVWILLGLAILVLGCACPAMFWIWKVWRQHPAENLIAAGYAAFEEQRLGDALANFKQAQEEGGELPLEAVLVCANAHLELGDFPAAEARLAEILARDPRHKEANRLVCALLRLGGKNWEMRAYLPRQILADSQTLADLIAVTSDEFSAGKGFDEDKNLENDLLRLAITHHQPIALLSGAHRHLQANQAEEALPILRELVERAPHELNAQGRLGQLLSGSRGTGEFLQWHRKLPANAADHPEIWVAWGRYAEASGERQVAARCYGEALLRHADHPLATYRLSQVFSGLNLPREAALLGERAKSISELQMAVSEAMRTPTGVRRVAEQLEALGRLWESWGWSDILLHTRSGQGDMAWARDHVRKMHQKLKPNDPWVVDSHNPAKSIDFSRFPLPDWNASEAAPIPGAPRREEKLIAFSDQARAAGIDFTYFNGAVPGGNRAYMFEFSGGGVAVLDLDGDGWPDLYLTQGCDWPPEPNQRKYDDRLFRNLGDGRFADATRHARLQGFGFGQGVAAGDIDNDGFTDLYVANIGGNQLYRNNGDGTFTEITAEAGLGESQVWTLSALIADLNGDGLAELYDVNYLGGPTVFTEACFHAGTIPIQCHPTQFPAEQDRLYENLGAGRFREISTEAGLVAPGGKGMGIVAADFDGSRRLSLFVTNDTTPNFFFRNETPPGGPLRFREQATLLGVALSESGKAASCMGIALGDANGNGLLDLFVTNFQGEANNFFEQTNQMLFEDRIRGAGLHDAGFAFEGWGAQFLDADLDGSPDLVVANGHLGDYLHTQATNKMPTQVFINRGPGQFDEAPATALGEYFSGRRLGRAVARLDWNRDGLPDFCCTHADAPVALLANQTREHGNYLWLALRAVRSQRDAIGAKVYARCGERTFQDQLVAGDGFQASNQRTVHLGLGSRSMIDELRVEWPSGAIGQFQNVPANQELLLVEGANELFRLPR